MIGRIVRPADFERVLSTRPCSRSAHFAAHHVSGSPGAFSQARAAKHGAQVVPEVSPELSTEALGLAAALVDESSLTNVSTPSHHVWLGLVVPKRHAKRAVTRNLIKRQIRSLMAEKYLGLAPGLWVVRLRAGFDRADFRSPASNALRESARAEIARLLDLARHSESRALG